MAVVRSSEFRKAFKWDLAEIWYATSEDGVNWVEHGVALTRGEKGRFDDRSVFTPNILLAENKYYLVYQAVKAPYRQRTKNVIAMAVADSPKGPWNKFKEPVLRTDDGGEWSGEEAGNRRWIEAETPGTWDSMKIHDSGFLVRGRKYWLYTTKDSRSENIPGNRNGEWLLPTNRKAPHKKEL